MSTLVPSSQEPVSIQDKAPHSEPLPLKKDNPSFVLHGIDNVKYEEVSTGSGGGGGVGGAARDSCRIAEMTALCDVR
jgi:hypothetical protein